MQLLQDYSEDLWVRQDESVPMMASWGQRTSKVFDVDISSQANKLFHLLGISTDCSHVQWSLSSLVSLVDLVLLPR